MSYHRTVGGMDRGSDPAHTPNTEAVGEAQRSDFAGPSPSDDLSVVHPDHYEIEREVARGGMGRVLVARDAQLARRVAIKRPIVDTPAARARFMREALLTARLQHPSIVPLYQAGRLPSGEPFYTMRMVEGRSLGDLAKDRPLAGRLQLLPNLQAVADAVAYAHAQGIIHRDLKPSNVLIGDFGETVVIDWGLAKDLRGAANDADLAEGSSDPQAELTRTGLVLGTVGYMSPEQGRGLTVDERVDVYALGAMLYWLLSGERPGPDRVDASALRGVPRDLVAIAAKATAAVPGDRYPNAGGFAEELRRFLAGQLVASHDYTRGELLWRWLERNRRPVWVALAALVALIAFGGVSLFRILASEHRARSALAVAGASRTLADAEGAITSATLVELWTELGRQAEMNGDPFLAARYLAEAYGRSIEPRAALRLLVGHARALVDPPIVLRGHTDRIGVVRFAPDGRRLVTGSRDKTLRLWDLQGRREIATLRGDAAVSTASFSADGSRLVAGSIDGVVRVWDAASGAPLVTLAKQAGPIHTVRFAANDSRIVSFDGTTVRLFDSTTGAAVATIEGGWWPVVIAHGDVVLVGVASAGAHLHDARDGRRLAEIGPGMKNDPNVTNMAVSPRGDFLATIVEAGVEVWRIADRRRIARLPVHPTSEIAFSGDASLLIVDETETRRTIWDVATGQQVSSPDLERGAVGRVVVDPAGPYAAMGGRGILSLVELRTGRSLMKVAAAATVFDVSPDGAWLAVGGVGRHEELVVWPIRSLEGPRVPSVAGRACCIDVTADGTVVIAGADGAVRLEAAGGAATTLDSPDAGSPKVLRAAAHGGLVARVSATGGLALLAPGETPRPLATETTVTDVVFSDNGQLMATTEEGGAPRLWDTATGAVVARLDGQARALGFLGDGRLVTGGASGVAVWAKEGRPLSALAVPGGKVVAVSGVDGRHLMTAATNDTPSYYQIVLWDVPRGTQLASLSGPHDGFTSFAMNPDGKTVAAGGDNDTIQILDAETGERRSLVRGAGDTVDLAFLGPDVLVSAGRDGHVRVWDLVTSRLLLTGGRGGDPATALRVSAAALTIVSSHESGQVAIWRLPVETGPNAEVRERVIRLAESPSAGR